jgi:hypothetical protein
MKTASMLLAALLLTIAAPAGALADDGLLRDHMRCHRVDDPSTIDAVVDVDTVALGRHAGCTVKATAREVCTPVGADVLDPPRTEDAVRGERLLGERLCYVLRCPGVTPGLLVASDRFGKREVSLKKTKRLCTAVEPVR